MTQEEQGSPEKMFALYKEAHKLSIIQCAFRLHDEGVMRFERFDEVFYDLPGTDLEERTLAAGMKLVNYPALIEELYEYCWDKLKYLIPVDKVYTGEKQNGANKSGL